MLWISQNREAITQIRAVGVVMMVAVIFVKANVKQMKYAEEIGVVVCLIAPTVSAVRMDVVAIVEPVLVLMERPAAKMVHAYLTRS